MDCSPSELPNIEDERSRIIDILRVSDEEIRFPSLKAHNQRKKEIMRENLNRAE